jgi:hypothetical protein
MNPNIINIGGCDASMSVIYDTAGTDNDYYAGQLLGGSKNCPLSCDDGEVVPADTASCEGGGAAVRSAVLNFWNAKCGGGDDKMGTSGVVTLAGPLAAALLAAATAWQAWA